MAKFTTNVFFYRRGIIEAVEQLEFRTPSYLAGKAAPHNFPEPKYLLRNLVKHFLKLVVKDKC